METAHKRLVIDSTREAILMVRLHDLIAHMVLISKSSANRNILRRLLII